MKKSFRKTTFLSALAIAVPAMGMAQDKVEASVGADFVSGYIWRGQDLGGVSIQPTLSVSYKGFSLSAWGTTGIEKEDTKDYIILLNVGVLVVSVLMLVVPTMLISRIKPIKAIRFE